MTSLERAVAELLAAAGELEGLDPDGAGDALDRALARREGAFAAVRAAASERPSAAVLAQLRRVEELDARVLERARRSRDALIGQLRDLRGAGAAVRTWEPGDETPRFVSRRA